MDPIVILRDNAYVIAVIGAFILLAAAVMFQTNRIETRDTQLELLEVKLERLGTQLEIERKTSSDAVNRAKEAADRNYEIKLRCQALERENQELRDHPEKQLLMKMKELIWKDPESAIVHYGDYSGFDELYFEALFKLSKRYERCLVRWSMYQNPRWSQKAEKTRAKLEQLNWAAEDLCRNNLLVETDVTIRD
ncbi:hypothetical protein EOM57_02025 [Candidatus Saccharibacteria bacterium]|nr:hypothetical protein [Candidatus Saccharibacteria bacterium]